MLALNPLEIAVLTCWIAGVVAALAGLTRGGSQVRGMVALAVALVAPVFGSILAIAYAVSVHRRHAGRQDADA